MAGKNEVARMASVVYEAIYGDDSLPSEEL